MSLSGSSWSSSLYSKLTAKGMCGSELNNFCDIVGNGSTEHVIGKSFETMDTGTVPGNGIGIGTGIIGLIESDIKNQMYQECVGSFGQAGTSLLDFCEAVAASCVDQMALATLNSTHNKVFLGTGLIVVGSIAVIPSGWGDSIKAKGVASTMQGTMWGAMAEAMGDAMANGVLSGGTGSVVISGSPSGIPSSGTGTGIGVIS